MKRASVFVRLVSLLVDLLVVAFFFILLCLALITATVVCNGAPGLPGLFRLAPVLMLGLLLIPLFYFTYLTMAEGQTVGKNLFGIKVVRTDGEAPGFWRSLARTLFGAFSVLPFMQGFFLALFFGKRAPHDLVTGTQVIEEEM